MAQENDDQGVSVDIHLHIHFHDCQRTTDMPPTNPKQATAAAQQIAQPISTLRARIATLREQANVLGNKTIQRYETVIGGKDYHAEKQRRLATW